MQFVEVMMTTPMQNLIKLPWVRLDYLKAIEIEVLGYPEREEMS